MENMTTAPQPLIEAKMKEISDKGNCEMALLLSNEGLPLAEYYRRQPLAKDNLVELSLLFRQAKKTAEIMADMSDIKEMLVEGFNHRKLAFRFFQAFGQEVALVIVVSPKKSYRALTNALIRSIEAVSF
jgi:predicted regulator of Ras-like GTPase activity (Roadblock/LC7/MglB family)